MLNNLNKPRIKYRHWMNGCIFRYYTKILRDVYNMHAQFCIIYFSYVNVSPDHPHITYFVKTFGRSRYSDAPDLKLREYRDLWENDVNGLECGVRTIRFLFHKE